MFNVLNFLSQNPVILSGTFAGAALLTLYIIKSSIFSKANSKEWKYIGKIRDLYLYPLKSGHYLKVHQAQCTTFGLKQLEEDESSYQMLDRFLIVYREGDKSYCTSKTFPSMVLITVSVHDQEYLALDGPNMRTLYVKRPSLEGGESKDHVFLWGNQKVMTLDCGNEAASWVSRYILGKDSGLRLGLHDASERRNLKKYLPEFLDVYTSLRDESTGLYSDIGSYLVINESSVRDLNTRLNGVLVSHLNFRPNIVIDGEDLPPYDEDDWEYLKINDMIFKYVKYCPRCLVTNVNADDGTRLPDLQPLTELKKYRKLKDVTNIKLEGEHPLFGSYFEITEGENSIIKKGDDVFMKKR